jgi:S1-C subfamily serine protease
MGMASQSLRLTFILVLALVSLVPHRIHAQVDPSVGDRVIPAAVQIAFVVEVIENGVGEPIYVPVGSGTVVSRDGLVLTNWHVVDNVTRRTELDQWEAENLAAGLDLRFDLLEGAFLILTAGPAGPPEITYVAELAATD